MSELCLSTTSSRFHLLRSRIKSDFFLLCSFVFSHPLHFTVLIFFFPYIHKILSFAFPLFVTTSLFLLAFLTFVPNCINDKQSAAETKVSFLTSSYRTIVELLRSKIDNQRVEYLRLEDFEVFRAVFDNPTTPDADVANQGEESEAESKTATTSSVQEDSQQDFNVSSSPDEGLASPTELDSFAESESNWGDMEDADDKKLGSSWQDWDDEFEEVKAKNSDSSVENKKNAPSCTGANKAKFGEKKSLLSNGSEAAAAGEAETGDNDKIKRNNSVGKGEKSRGEEEYSKSKLLKAHSHSIGASSDYTNDHGSYSLRVQSSPSLDYSYGSMRKEKEWKRTLACKLFEERHNNVSGAGDQSAEGMDLLWETYESETSAAKNRANGKKKNSSIKQNSKKKYEIKVHEEEEDNDEAEDDDSGNGQLCCLQALKFSTGKMNLGMGRPNLVKISKAIKGIGWLHSFKKHHSKKVHHGGDSPRY